MTAASNNTAALFPLPLSDFEFYMLSDDRPAYPMVLVMRAGLTGRLLRPEFETALKETLVAQPLLHCRVRKIPRIGWCWEPIRDLSAAQVLDWQDVDSAEAVSFHSTVRAINVRETAGIAVEVRAAADVATLVLHLHHACCDGLGALQVMGELLARYGRRTTAAGSPLPEFTAGIPEMLLHRESFETDNPKPRPPRTLKQTLGKLFRVFCRKPGKLAASPRQMFPGEGRPVAIRSLSLSNSDLRALRQTAVTHGCSVNSLLTGELLRHIREWNRAAGQPFGSKWIRLGIPLSMRTTRHIGMPACNVVSYSLVTRRESDCDDQQALWKSIQLQTTAALIHREGLIAWKLFRRLRRVPGAMRVFLTMKPCLSTVVLTNAGDLTRRFDGRFPLHHGRWTAGNVLVDTLCGAAPVRPNTRAALTVTEYAGTLTISLRTDERLITDTDSERFLAQFAKRVLSLHADSQCRTDASRMEKPESPEQAVSAGS